MFHLIKGIIWLIGLVFVTNFVLQFFDKTINWTAIENSLRACTPIVTPCQNILTDKADSTDREQCSARCLSGFSSWIVSKK